MKARFALLGAVAALTGFPASSLGAAVTPVQKVVQLLEGMLEKGKAEKHAEQVQYAAFKQFCDDTTVEKNRAIKEEAERIDLLKADIAKNLADAERLTREIATHDEDISVWKGDAAAAQHVREIEKDDHDATHKDYSESIDALGRAIEVVKGGNKDKAQSLLQVASLAQLRLVPVEAKRMIDAFIEQGHSASAPPAALAYEAHSHGIVEMLNELLNKFTAERTELEKAEMSSKHHFELLMQDLTAQLAEATKDRDRKAALKASKLEAKAAAEADLEDVLATQAADQTYLAGLTAICAQKASDFESRQALRAEEIVAVEKAIEIISSQAVAGSAAKHLPKLLQASALVQLRRSATNDRQLRSRLGDYLRGKAAKLHSQALSMLANSVADDPFVKVRKMIEDLLTRLQEQAAAEADHKSWCDEELATNEQTRNAKTAAVESLHAQADELEASIAKLANDIAENTAAIAQLDAAMKEATALRQQEKATNTATIADAQAAQTAVAQAISVLKEFYAKAATATVFAQQQPEIPEIFGSAYTGMQSENGGVVGMLEVIQTDFARLESDTKAAETSAQKAYDTFTSESLADKAARTTDIEHLESKKQDETQAQTVNRKDLEGTQAELEAALAYYDKLKPACIDSGVAYEDRVARRQEELASLHEALAILNSKE